MKKTGIVLALALVGGLLYFLLTSRLEKTTSADFLPDTALACVEQHDLAQLLDDFKTTRLGQALNAVDVAKIASEIGVPPEEVHRIVDIRKEVTDFFSSPLYKEFFGRNITVAVLPISGITAEHPEQSLHKSLLLISQPEHNTDILKLMTSLFTGKLEPRTSKHGKRNLTHYTLDQDVSLTTAVVNGYVLAALDETVVKQALDRFDSKQGQLSHLPSYLRLRQEFPAAQFFAYASLSALSAQVKSLGTELNLIAEDELNTVLRQWQGWDAAAFGAWKEQGNIRDKAIMLFHKDQLDPLVAKMLEFPATDNKTAAMVPSGVLGYYWTNTLNMKTFWEMFIREIGDTEVQIKELEAEVKATTGMDLDQIFSLFGSEAALVLKEIVTNAFVPLPNGGVMVKVAKEEELLQLLQTVTKKLGFAVQTEEYKGKKIYLLGLSPHPDLQPAYVVHQGYLVLTSSLELLKNIVDQPAQKNLSADPAFQQANKILGERLSQPSNSISVLRFSSLMQLLKELANWSGVMLALQDPEVAGKAQVVIKEAVLPLLDGLAMYEVIGSRSEIKGDAVILESASVLATPAKP